MAAASANVETDCQPEEGAGSAASSSGRRGDRAQGQPNVTNFDITNAFIRVSDVKADVINAPGPIIILSHAYRMQHYTPSPNSRDEALKPIPPPEDLSYLFKPEDLKRGLEEKLFIPVAKAFDDQCNWRWFGRKLEIDTPVFNHLNMMYSCNVPELVYQMLVFYKRKNPLKTMGDVVKALCNSRNQIPVKALKKYFDEQETG